MSFPSTGHSTGPHLHFGNDPLRTADRDSGIDPQAARQEAATALLMRHREQRMAYSADTIGCSCGWAPRPADKAGASRLKQYAQHVADELDGGGW